jgi:hypothetical protein
MDIRRLKAIANAQCYIIELHNFAMQELFD